jgi:tetratricopeptide (TPR) repeat protein
LKQLASIYRVTKRLEKAKEFELRVVALVHDDAEAHYTLGVIDWMMTYRNAVVRLATEGLTDDGVGNLSKSRQACTDLLAENQYLNDEGIREFTKAIALQPNYRDAMIYINLVYRRKADLHCGSSGDEQTDIASAVDWTKRVELIDKAQPPIVSKPPK